jgi:hypothetical protein
VAITPTLTAGSLRLNNFALAVGDLGNIVRWYQTQDLPGTTALLAQQEVDIVWADQQLSPGQRPALIRDPEGNLINIFGLRLAA